MYKLPRSALAYPRSLEGSDEDSEGNKETKEKRIVMISMNAFMILVLVLGIATALLGLGLVCIVTQTNKQIKGLEDRLVKMQERLASE